MPDEVVGILGILAMFALIALRFHVGIAMIIPSALGLWYLAGLSPVQSLMGTAAWNQIASWTFSTIPMFLLMGYLAAQAGLIDRLFDAARAWLTRLPGNLAIATVGASGGFAAASGSSIATTVAMARIAVPPMRQRGYQRELAAGAVAMGGTLGAIIPPSILIVIYAIIVEAPIGPVLMAGFLPGILSIVAFSAMIAVRTRFNPGLAPGLTQAMSLRERARTLPGVWPLPLIIFIIVGGIYTGIATPTEAGAVAAVVALVAGVLNRSLTRKGLWEALSEAVRFTAVITFLLAGVSMMIRFLALSGLAQLLSEFVTGLELSAVPLVLTISLGYLILGMFMDTLAMLLLTIPILLPVLATADVNLIWFGIIVVKLMEIGLVTPPFGVAVYVLSGVLGRDYPIPLVFKGLLWFLATDIIVVLILVFFPDIVMILPDLMRPG